MGVLHLCLYLFLILLIGLHVLLSLISITRSPGKKLWMSFNGVAGRVVLFLFQQSYKGFKGKFFKIRYNKFDPTLLDGFPLY